MLIDADSVIEVLGVLRADDFYETVHQFAADETLAGSALLEKAEQQILALSRQSAQGKPQHIMEIGADSYETYISNQETYISNQ